MISFTTLCEKASAPLRVLLKSVRLFLWFPELLYIVRCGKINTNCIRRANDKFSKEIRPQPI